MQDSDILNSDVTLTGVMEPKTFTITIKSNNSNNQTRTYSAKYGERFTLPSCPFSAVTNYTFNNYTCNGTTYSVGGGFTVIGDMVVTCNWGALKIAVEHWLLDSGLFKFKILAFPSKFNGKKLKIQVNMPGIGNEFWTHVDLYNSVLNKEQSIGESKVYTTASSLYLSVEKVGGEYFDPPTKSKKIVYFSF